MHNLIFFIGDDISNENFLNFSPFVNELSKSSLVFNNYYTNISVCQPSRAVFMTGLYPVNNGVVGFHQYGKIKSEVKTIIEVLKNKNYYCGTIGKSSHFRPQSKFPWDFVFESHTKDINLLLEKSIDFKNKLKKPFVLFVNSNFAHREFAENKNVYITEDNLPYYLPKNKKAETQYNQYLGEVKKFDELIKEILNLFDTEECSIIITSDNGASFPFVKGNCYPFSCNLPLILNIPGVVPRIDNDHYLASIDILPTLIDVLFNEYDTKLDGKSFKNVIYTQQDIFFQERKIYLTYNKGYDNQDYDARGVFDKNFCYIINYWNQKNIEKGMDVDADTNLLDKNLIEFYKLRCQEEFYNMEKQITKANNQVNNILKENYKNDLIKHLERTKDYIYKK